MGRLAAEYFKRMDEIQRDGAERGAVCCDSGNPGTPARFNMEYVNLLLKEAFRAFCAAAENPLPVQFGGLEERYLMQLRDHIA
jgi:hypothetical protein